METPTRHAQPHAFFLKEAKNDLVTWLNLWYLSPTTTNTRCVPEEGVIVPQRYLLDLQLACDQAKDLSVPPLAPRESVFHSHMNQNNYFWLSKWWQHSSHSKDR